MKKEKILAIILIMNFMLFYVSNIVFAINIDNSLVETKTEEIDSNIEDELDNEIKEPDIIDDESEEIEEETKTETEPNENQESEEAKTEPNENQESEEAETESNENEDSEEIKEDKKQEEILTIQQNIGKSIQTIKNGTYVMSSALSSRMVLDVSGGSTANCANVQVWESANVSQQKFKITYLNNGYYKIECAKSKKVLDVMNAGKTNGTNVHQYQSNNTEAQDWIIKNAGNGYFYIVSRCNGLYLDVSGGSAANGTNVQLYLGNNTKAQKFKFKEGYMGIDVSSYQASINWASVKEYGIDFTMLRIGGRYYGSGGIYEDICFAKNAIGAKANNIDIGIYFYSQAITKQEAKEEANFVINTLRKYNVKVTYPVVIDTERTPGGTGRADGLSAKDRTDICIEFLETIKSAGYKPMLYANKEWLINDLEISRLSNYDVWLAHYTKQTDYKNSYTMWQYTSSGSIPGILGNVDMDICYTKYF